MIPYTNRKQDLYLWKKDRDHYYLQAPTRDCWRYWGCNYIITRHSHNHFAGIGLKLLQGFNDDNAMLDKFNPTLSDSKARRDLIAILKHVQHLKDRAEFLKLWWHINKISVELLSMYPEREKEIENINTVLLPKLLNTINDLFIK